ncbi:N-acetylmuramoyl-L-alanine amidase-like domain-containing protein, partial [Salmonella enterica]
MIMKVNAWTILLMSAHLTACAVPGTEKYQTSMDSVTAEKISRIIQSDVIPYKGENHGEVISRVSSAFLGTPYQADTLIGGPGIPEVLVANFNGVDCFTLADYVEALARS